jgi:KDO2-lipid IV(A) lauroyltransferase
MNTELLRPRYWPVWLGLGVLRLLVALPARLQLRLGAACGQFASQFNQHRRRIVAINLQLCFPDLDQGERERLLEAHFAALGMGVIETAAAWWASDTAIAQHGTLEGLEHLDAVLAEGRGVLLLTAHFTTLELGARYIAMQRPFHALYRAHDNPAYQAVMRRWRERRSRLPPITRKNMRDLLRALRQGRIVWYALDQDFSDEAGVFVPFFGVPTLTLTATTRLVRLTGARVVPYFPCRLPDGRYQVRILPVLDGFGEDEVQDAARINALIEAAVRNCPEQYFWVHRRFKTRPAGYPEVYA